MAQKCRRHVLARNAAAIVRHTDIRHAAAADFHRDNRRAGVNGIFHKLLNDGRRALHHLTGSDQLRDLLFQNVNFRHFLHLPFALNLFQHICKLKQNVHGFDRRQRVDVQAFQAV